MREESRETRFRLRRTEATARSEPKANEAGVAASSTTGAREAGVVIDGRGGVVHWHLPAGRTSIALPDSRSLWDVLWEGRDRIAGFAHSHPGAGLPVASQIDRETFVAIEAGLGRRLQWWIVSSTHTCVLTWDGQTYAGAAVAEEPAWVEELRRRSARALREEES